MYSVTAVVHIFNFCVYTSVYGVWRVITGSARQSSQMDIKRPYVQVNVHVIYQLLSVTSNLSLSHSLSPKVSWSPCGNMLSSTSFDATTCVWDKRSGGMYVNVHVYVQCMYTKHKYGNSNGPNDFVILALNWILAKISCTCSNSADPQFTVKSVYTSALGLRAYMYLGPLVPGVHY